MFKAFIAPVRTPIVLAPNMLNEKKQDDQKLSPKLQVLEGMKHEEQVAQGFPYSMQETVAFAQ